jgi:hypothetical protein
MSTIIGSEFGAVHSPGDGSPVRATQSRGLAEARHRQPERYCEIRMLFYVGKDLVRWIEQCLEHLSRHPELGNSNIRYQSFAAYLVNHAPPPVQAKLRKWGVADYKSIFTRALGLNSVLADVPDKTFLSEEFIRNYYRYADQMFLCRQSQAQFAEIGKLGFEFEIYASGEYSRMLEREWAETDASTRTRPD